MSRKQLPASRRAAIWQAYEYRCIYCTELISFANLDVDHIVPFHLKDEPDKLKALLIDYGLSNDFELEGLLNLVPSHRHCNLQKSGVVLSKSRAIHFLTIAESRFNKAVKIEKEQKEQLKKDKVTILLQIALDEGRISHEELSLLASSYANSQRNFEVLATLPFVDSELKGFLSSTDIDSLYDRPILPRLHGLESLTLAKTTSTNCIEKIEVFSCREWAEAIQDGFYALTSYDIKEEFFFKRVYALVTALAKAKPADLCFISDLKVSIANFDLLPITVLPALSNEEWQELQSYTSQGLGITDLIKKGDVKIISCSPLSLTLHYNYMGLYLTEILRADLNGNGVEDILVGCYEWALQGTLGFGNIIALTRLGVDQPFTILKDIDLDVTRT